MLLCPRDNSTIESSFPREASSPQIISHTSLGAAVSCLRDSLNSKRTSTTLSPCSCSIFAKECLQRARDAQVKCACVKGSPVPLQNHDFESGVILLFPDGIRRLPRKSSYNGRKSSYNGKKSSFNFVTFGVSYVRDLVVVGGCHEDDLAC